MQPVSESIDFVSLNPPMKIKAYTRCYLQNKWLDYFRQLISTQCTTQDLWGHLIQHLLSPQRTLFQLPSTSLAEASAYGKELFNKPNEMRMSACIRGYNMLSLENLAVWMWRESKGTLPHFCNKAVIRTFLIKKVDPWDEVIDRYSNRSSRHYRLTWASRACSWREHQRCNRTPCYK